MSSELDLKEWENLANRIRDQRNAQKFYMKLPDTSIDKLIMITGCFSAQAKHLIGKVVQIKREAGAFGSDSVCLRLPDGSLHPFENVAFYELSESDSLEYEKLYDGMEDEMSLTERYYTYSGDGNKEKIYGAIVPSKVKEGESTPMRDVLESIDRELENILEKNKSRE